MLKYKCLLCGVEWGDLADENNISHGYCPKCIREKYSDKIRTSQVKGGYSSCFNMGYNDCSEKQCSFRSACQEHKLQEWKDKVINQ